MIEVPAAHISEPRARAVDIGDTQREGAVECDVESATGRHGKSSSLPAYWLLPLSWAYTEQKSETTTRALKMTNSEFLMRLSPDLF